MGAQLSRKGDGRGVDSLSPPVAALEPSRGRDTIHVDDVLPVGPSARCRVDLGLLVYAGKTYRAFHDTHGSDLAWARAIARRTVSQLMGGTLSPACAEHKRWTMTKIFEAANAVWEAHSNPKHKPPTRKQRRLLDEIEAEVGLDCADLVYMEYRRGPPLPPVCDFDKVDITTTNAMFLDPFETLPKLVKICQRDQSVTFSSDPKSE
ncbi:hypothetical protein KIPB_008603 [Kipferlia bialata]|uniref:Uncharacterized protein n=1 Tax=Kipferlia bialata TaxID=797122 RepID=A0A9K3D101_9EUKA|nr:hypothetical protein KIPB_008603 [Kipferlia bialata]|eukprot:g8603.t1